MSLVLRIISVCILGGLFIILLFTSFFSESEITQAPDFSNAFTQDYIGDEASGSTVKQQNISLFETLFSNQEEIVIGTGSQDSIEVSLDTPGIYVSSFRDLRKTYTFLGKNFSIEQEGIGEIFIDTQSYTGSVLLVPLNTSAKVTLYSDTGEEYTSIFLTPHMYLEFQPARGRFLKNTDAIRVQTIYNLGYIAGSISHIYDDPFFLKYKDSIDSFFTPTLVYITKRDISLQRVLTTLKDQKIQKIPGYATIERYINLFVNKDKKIVFYKNIILDGFIDLLNTQDIDTLKIQQIQRDLNVLKNISPESYTAIIQMKNEMMALVNSNSDKEYSISKIAYASLQNDTIDEKSWLLSTFAFSLFTTYDSINTFNADVSKKYLQAVQEFIFSFKESEEHKNLRYQYFSYFLEKQLLFSLEKENSFNNVTEIISILSQYIKNSSIAYSSSTNLRVTGLYIYNEILGKIDVFLRTGYFQSERNTDNILLLHSNNKISATDVNDLKNESQKILEIYEKDKQYLNQSNARDNLITTEIQESKDKLLEYFSALENYETYTSLYEVSKQNTLNIETNNTEDFSLSKEKIMQYLSVFSGVNLSSANIEIHEDSYYYSLKNIFISGKNFSFDIYPFASYKIQNIIVDGKVSSFVYKLGVIESDWNEKYTIASKEEKEKYDFSRFFLITFLETSGNQVEEYVVDDVKYNEDTTSIVLKRDILLGKKGEFSTIIKFLDIVYSNLRVVKQLEYYDIFIENSAFNILKNTPDKTSSFEYKGSFNAEYILRPTEHYFMDISMNIFLENEGKKVELFGEEGLLFYGKLERDNFNTFFTNFSNNLSQYITIYQMLEARYPEGDIEKYYTILGDKMTFKFDFNGKRYTILFAGALVDKIYEGNKNILLQPISSGNITQYLPQ